MNKINYGICWLFARIFYYIGHVVSLTLNITNGFTYPTYSWLMQVSLYFDDLPGHTGLWKHVDDKDYE